MIAPAHVSVVLVTRGDVDMAPVVSCYPEPFEVIVWDNSRDEDLAVYGRYAAIDHHATRAVILVQDDDAILAPEAIDELLSRYEPETLTANMPARFRHDGYLDSCLVGFGAIFDRHLPERAFDRFCAHYFPDFGPGSSIKGHWSPERASRTQPSFLVSEFARTCDVVFSTLTRRVLVDVPYADREFASAPNRMWLQPDHVGERAATLERARAVLGL